MRTKRKTYDEKKREELQRAIRRSSSNVTRAQRSATLKEAYNLCSDCWFVLGARYRRNYEFNFEVLPIAFSVTQIDQNGKFVFYICFDSIANRLSIRKQYDLNFRPLRECESVFSA